MTNMDRREALLGIFGVTTVTSVVPAVGADAAPSDGLSQLLDATLERIRSFEHGGHVAATGAQRVFVKRTGARAEETYVVVRYTPGAFTEDDGQRFAYSIVAESIDYGMHIATHGDIDEALSGLAKTHAHLRKIDAADVLNNARVYNVMLGGDGKPLCSDSHPYDYGTWSNIVPSNPELSDAAVSTALDHIKTTFIDDGGIKIYARGEKLVVPTALKDRAEGVAKSAGLQLIVVDDLTDPAAWFVTTNIDGLVWSEMHPFSLHATIDQKENKILVYGHEKRKFAFNDPRAVVGSFPGKTA